MMKPNFMEKLLDGVEVEWKSFGEVAKIQRGASPRPIEKFITDEENGVPWIKIGDTSPNSKYVDTTKQKITPEGATKSRILKKGDFIMSNSMSFGRPYILNIDGAIHDGWASISDFGDKLNSDFLYHYLSSDLVQSYWASKINSGSVSNLNSDIIKSLDIPIPPLKVQEEIVCILDAFAELTAELTAELEAELTARKKQYEYYRDNLLTFEDGEVEWKMLGEMSEIYDGTHQTPKYTNSGVPFVSVQNIRDLYATEKYISVDDFEKYKYKPRKDDIFMTRIGDIGTCAVVENDEPLAYYVTLTLIRVDQKFIIPKYLKHVIESSIGKSELYKRTLVHATPIKINLGEIGKINIPLPTLPEQARIVSILDKFDALTSSITEGLPREFELRQKQYEYYHNMLLSFPKEEAEA